MLLRPACEPNKNEKTAATDRYMQAEPEIALPEFDSH
jgi:hypothetical protein